VVSFLDALARIDKQNTYSVCYRLSRIRAWRHFYCPKAPNFRLKIFQEPFLFPRKADIFHSGETRLPDFELPSTVAAHAVADWVFTDDNGSQRFREKRRARYREIARRGAVVVANSECTRQTLIEHAGIAPEKITVNYLGVPEQFRPRTREEIDQVRKQFGLPEKYLLAVAAFSPRKNMERVLRIYADLRRAGKLESVPVLVGSMKSWKNAAQIIERFCLADKIVLTGHVPNHLLPAIYSGARMLVHPSLAEGFGLPLLEAMACGTPAITSDRQAMPEVVGDAGILVDPENDDDIRDRMIQLDGDDNLRRMLSDRCLERAKFFTWERHARKLLEIWQEIARDHQMVLEGSA